MHSMQNAYQIQLSKDIISNQNIKGNTNMLPHAVVLCVHEVVLAISSHTLMSNSTEYAVTLLRRKNKLPRSCAIHKQINKGAGERGEGA